MKLSPLTIIIIGVAIAIIALSFGYFSNYAPNMLETSYYNENAEQLEAEANKMSAAKQRVDNAIEDVNKMATDWQAIVIRKTPPASVEAGGINLAVNRYQLTVDSLKFRNNVQRAVNAQIRRGGVEVINGPLIPQPTDSAAEIVETYYQYPARGFPVCIFEVGTITVRGTWAQISNHVRSWSSMPGYLAVADGLNITGTSPVLTANYNLVIVAYIRGDKIAPPVTGGGAPAPGGGGGGGGTAPGGGFGGGAAPRSSRG